MKKYDKVFIPVADYTGIVIDYYLGGNPHPYHNINVKEQSNVIVLTEDEWSRKEIELNEWRQECDRLAKVAEFWQEKYDAHFAPRVPPRIDNLSKNKKD